MNNIVSWVKNNQLRAAAIVLLIAAGSYTQWFKPRSLDDCISQVIEDAQGGGSAGKQNCYNKFPNEPQSAD